MRDVDIVVYSDVDLQFKVDLDNESEDGNPSLYLVSGQSEIRHFATTEQLIQLRDLLLEAIPLAKTVEAPLLHPEDLKE